MTATIATTSRRAGDRVWSLAVACGVAIAALACGGEAADEAATAGEEPAAQAAPAVSGAEVAREYAPDLQVDLARMTRTPSGLYIQDLQAGSGSEATAGREVVVHYTGWLPDGQKFDSSVDRAEPFSFVLGGGNVIAGWDEGVAGMKVGGRRRLVIPPDLGYGASGAGGTIPPNATLVFDVELLEVR
jgi:FKBP-type peptidyl-prolyl cis-trans isomerase FkpA